MKKQRLLGIITFVLYIVLSAVCVCTLKYCDNVTVAFSVYYILHGTFVFLLAAFDSLWGFCAYSFTALLLNFILPFPSYSVFLLSALATLPSIALIRVFNSRLQAGSLLSFSVAALLRYVIEHYGLRLLSSSVSHAQYTAMQDLFGVPGLICTVILILLTVLLYPAVKLTVGENKANTDITKGQNDVGNISKE